MAIWRMMIREVGYRKLNSVLALLGVCVAVSSLIGALTLLRLHDVRTEEVLSRKEAETEAKMAALEADVKKGMHRLGYNAVILPKHQPLGDWYAEDYAVKCMPESSAAELGKTVGICERYVPRLRQRVKWREKKWTVILVGVGEEHILDTSVADPKPLAERIGRGTCVVGYEVHHALELKAEGPLVLLGEIFRVARCEKQLGTKDDITIWVNLADAQELLSKRGLINEILIVEHLSVWGALKEVRRRVAAVLPDCQVVEFASETLARAHARRKVAEEAKASVERERERRSLIRAEMKRAAFALVPLGLFVCTIWIGFLMYLNVRDRAPEIGTLMAIGFQRGQVQRLVLSKSALLGVLGGLLGFALGTGIPLLLEASKHGTSSLSRMAEIQYFGVAQAVAIAVCLLASWVPARVASGLDPADVLRGE